jgi:hypothetical protein
MKKTVNSISRNNNLIISCYTIHLKNTRLLWQLQNVTWNSYQSRWTYENESCWARKTQNTRQSKHFNVYCFFLTMRSGFTLIRKMVGKLVRETFARVFVEIGEIFCEFSLISPRIFLVSVLLKVAKRKKPSDPSTFSCNFRRIFFICVFLRHECEWNVV